MTIYPDHHVHSKSPGVPEAAVGASQGAVVLDIGGSVGAAVVVTTQDFDGMEIEIHRFGDPWDGTHVAVRSRPGREEPVFAAVYPHLEEGSYELRQRPFPDGGKVVQLEVLGGRVAELNWDC